MAWKNATDDSSEVMIVTAVVVIVGLYVLFSYISRAVLLSLVGVVLVVALVGVIGWYGFRYWQVMARRERSVPVSSPVDAMSLVDFEEYLVDIFKSQNYKVFFTPNNAAGVDLMLEKNGIKTIVITRHQAQNVGVDAVQQAVTAMRQYATQKSMIVTNAYFTKTTITMARANECELVDRTVLLEAQNK